jgi:hypothetical protein
VESIGPSTRVKSESNGACQVGLFEFRLSLDRSTGFSRNMGSARCPGKAFSALRRYYEHKSDNNIGFRVASTLRQTNGSFVPDFAGQALYRLPCGAWQVQSPGHCPVSDCLQLGQIKTGRAGPVGPKARTPRRAIYRRRGVGCQKDGTRPRPNIPLAKVSSVTER